MRDCRETCVEHSGAHLSARAGATGCLYIVPTPIGNLGDITARALEALRAVDALACEDTRRTRILFSHFQIPRPRILISYREHMEDRAGQTILAHLREGRNVAVCTDGGFPGVSDPGYRIVRTALASGIAVTVIPGASAVHVALVASGLPTSSYTFKGYPPRKPGALRRFFEEEKESSHTLVIFESPFRVLKTLQAARETLGNREAAVCAELTKVHERVSRGHLDDLCAAFDGKTVKGEITIVIAGSNPKFMGTADDVVKTD